MSMKYISLIRPQNCIMAGLASVIGGLIGGAPCTPLLFLVPFFVCAGGMAVNDYYDRELDVVKGRPVATGEISPRDALTVASLSYALGIFLSALLSPAHLFLAALISLVTYVYSRYTRNRKYLGNFLVAAGPALSFIFGALGGESSLVILLSVAAFLASMAREIVKDLEDLPVDLGYKNTLPMVIGKKKAEVFAAVYTFSAILVSFFPYFLGLLGGTYLGLIFPVDLLFLYASVLACEGEYSRAQRLYKSGMFLALMAFLAGSVAW